jgi:hypothetical protein
MNRRARIALKSVIPAKIPPIKFKKWHDQFDKDDQNPLGAQEKAILHPMQPASGHSNKLLNRGKRPKIDTVPQHRYESAKSDFWRKQEAKHRGTAKQYPEGGRMHQDAIIQAELAAKKAVSAELKHPSNAELRRNEGILNIKWGSNLSGKNLKWKTKSGESWHPVGDGKDRGGTIKEGEEPTAYEKYRQDEREKKRSAKSHLAHFLRSNGLHALAQHVEKQAAAGESVEASRKLTGWDIQKWSQSHLEEGFWEGDEKQRKDELAKANEDPEYRKLAREAYDTRHDAEGAENHKKAAEKAKALGLKTLADYHAHIAKNIELRTAEVNQPPTPEKRKEV